MGLVKTVAVFEKSEFVEKPIVEDNYFVHIPHLDKYKLIGFPASSAGSNGRIM